MKKLFATLFSLALIVSLTTLTSCGGPSNESVKKIIEKYDNDVDLTEADYSTLLDYVDAGMDDVIPVMKDAQDAAKDGDMKKLQKLQEKAEKLQEKYTYMDEVLEIIERADDDELGEANTKKAEKLLEKISSMTGHSY